MTTEIDPENATREKSLLNLPAISNLMARIGLLESQAFDRPRDENYFTSVAGVAMGLFRLVVVGEIKKGKSSFINGICSIPNLVPVQSDIATSTVFKVRYGPERSYTVFFQQAEEKQRKKLTVPLEQVDQYGTEKGNPENVKGVDFIAVEGPAPVLRDGLIIVDTPGVGGLFKKHRNITFRHAPKADAILFVTDSIEAPIGAAEIEFLKELRRITSFIYFVQTKAAKVDPEARRRRMENNIAILTGEVGFDLKDIRYFVVDSELKADADKSRNLEDLNDSGFVPLMAFLNDELKRPKDLNLAVVGLHRARDKFETVKAETNRKREILLADTAEKRQKLSVEILEAESALTEWNEKSRPLLLREFQEALTADVSDLQAALELELRPTGRISDMIANRLDAAGGASEVYQLGPDLLQDASAAASTVLINQITSLEKKVSALVRALATKAGTQLTRQCAEERAVRTFAGTGQMTLAEIRLRPPETDAFMKVRTVLYGGMAGIAIASVVGGVIGSVVPVVGTVIGSQLGFLVAAAWGGSKAFQWQGKLERRAARQEVIVVIDKALGNMLIRARAEFTKSSRQIENQAADALREIVRNNQQRLDEQRKAIHARERAGNNVLDQEERILKALERDVADVEKQLSAMETAVSA